MGAAVGSKTVGGSGRLESCSCGSVGLTSTMEERGGRFPRVAGIGIWPPPLPLPVEGCALVRLRKNVAGNTGTSRGVGALLSVLRPLPCPFASRKTTARIIAACASSEAPWARAGRRDLSNFRRWMGAPFAELGFKCEGISSCPRLSRTRLSQEFAGEGLVATSLPERERKSGSRMRRPPSPPRDSAKQRQEAGTSRLVRSSQKTIGCLWRIN